MVLVLLLGLGATASAYERRKDCWCVGRRKAGLIRARDSCSCGFDLGREDVVKVRRAEALKLEDGFWRACSLSRGRMTSLVAIKRMGTRKDKFERNMSAWRMGAWTQPYGFFSFGDKIPRRHWPPFSPRLLISSRLSNKLRGGA